MISVSILRAAGLTDEQIVRVIETEQKERELARREQNRKSQQNHRARQQISADRADKADSADKRRQKATVEDTPRARLFREGTAALVTLGRSERAARQLLAGWLKLTHDDDQLVLATVLRARDLAVADAAGWIMATLKSKVKGNGERNPTMAAFDDLIARAEGGEVPRDPGVVDVTPGRPQGR